MSRVDEIINTLTGWADADESHTPEEWLRNSLYLTLLSLPEASKLAHKESELAKMIDSTIREGKSAVEARNKAKGSPEWVAWSEQKAKLEMIRELVLISKKYASVAVQLGG